MFQQVEVKRAPLVVFDLRGVLLFSSYEGDGTDVVMGAEAHRVNDMWVWYNPDLKQIFAELFKKTFYYGIWSSQRSVNVAAQWAHLYGLYEDDIAHKPLFVWGAEHCELNPATNRRNLKRLAHIETALRWDMGYVVVFDDTPSKIVPTSHCVFPRPFPWTPSERLTPTLLQRVADFDWGQLPFPPERTIWQQQHQHTVGARRPSYGSATWRQEQQGQAASREYLKEAAGGFDPAQVREAALQERREARQERQSKKPRPRRSRARPPRQPRPPPPQTPLPGSTPLPNSPPTW
jgi:hypothetical protein